MYVIYVTAQKYNLHYLNMKTIGVTTNVSPSSGEHSEITTRNITISINS